LVLLACQRLQCKFKLLSYCTVSNLIIKDEKLDWHRCIKCCTSWYVTQPKPSLRWFQTCTNLWFYGTDDVYCYKPFIALRSLCMQLYQIHLHARICSFVKQGGRNLIHFNMNKTCIKKINILEPFQLTGEAFISTCNNGTIGIFEIIKLPNVCKWLNSISYVRFYDCSSSRTV
jgi:hypothetical protein